MIAAMTSKPLWVPLKGPRRELRPSLPMQEYQTIWKEKIESTDVALDGDFLHNRIRQRQIMDYYLTPGYAYIWSGAKGSGKTHGATNFSYIAWNSYDFEIITNKIFKRFDGDDKFTLCYPEGVHYVKTFLDIIRITAQIMKDSPTKKILVDIDESQNFMDAYHWSNDVALDLSVYLGVCRKFRQVWMFATPAFNLIPLAIRDWNRHTLTAHFFKSTGGVAKFNREAGTNFSTQQITFCEIDGYDHTEPSLVTTTPWTTPNKLLKPGDIIYDHEVPGNMLELGTIGTGKNKIPFSFRELVRFTEECISEDLPDRLMKFVREVDELNAGGVVDGKEVKIVERAPDWTKVRANMPHSELKEGIDKVLIPIMAIYTTKKGLEIADLVPGYSPATLNKKISLIRAPLKKLGLWPPPLQGEEPRAGPAQEQYEDEELEVDESEES
jgi:hypothetical protein